eukprot:symbB.v1.2.031057.t1/scaffold3565.1/size54034/3
MALVNRHLLLEYNVGGPRLWHERVALEWVSDENYVVVTPDRDIFVEQLSVLNPDLRSIRVRANPHAVPPGINAGEIYGVPAWSVAEMALIRAEGQRIAREERARAAPAVGGVAVGGGPAVGVPAATQHESGQLKWLAAEKGGVYEYGQEVSGVVDPPVKNAKAVHQLGAGESLFVMCIDGADLDDFKNRPSRCDLRILPVTKGGLGVPEISLKDVVPLYKEVDVQWELPGPRTTKWRLQTIEFSYAEKARDLESKAAQDHDAEPHGPVGVRRVAREVFPLPSFAVEELQDRTMSRSCQRRVLRRKHLQEESNRVIRGFNQLNNFCGGVGGVGSQPMGGPSAVQLKTLEFVEKCMGELGSPGDITGPGALSALRVSEGYEDLPSSSTLGSFDPALVSLPAGEVQSVDLAALWGEGGQTMVEEFIRSQLVSPNEALQRIQEVGPREVYSDPKLRVRRSYIDFVKKLINLGLVDLSTQKAQEEVGVFFVKKKQNKLRLILDCRRSDHWFKPPTAVSLATGESLRRIAVDNEEELFVCSADLANAFYTLSMPSELRGLFGLRRVRASELGVKQVGGQSVQENDWIQPRLAVLPMGWSWALYWCQKIHERLAEHSGLKEEERLKDFSPAPVGNFWHVQYVDNLHVFGTDREEVVSRFRRAVRVLKDAGLTVHEIEECEPVTKVLGWQYEPGHLFRPGRDRIWKIRVAVRQLLRQGCSSGHQLERLVGHMTFASLGKREMLSILGETYTFIRKFHGQTVPIWKSVRKELQTWEFLSPLIVQDLGSSWSTDLIAVDASEWGLGAIMREAKVEEVCSLGRFNERWRFKNAVSSNARVFAYLEDEKSRLATFEDEETTNPSESSPSFSAVPFTVIDHEWQVIGRRKWQKQEGMPVLEARASLYGVKRLLRKSSNFGKRFVILTDSMTAACAVSKGRAQTWRLRSVVQKISALLLATGSSLVSRWVPSEWNPSDGPSRGGFVASRPTRINLDGHPSRDTLRGAMASKREAKDAKEGAEDHYIKNPKIASGGQRQAPHLGHRVAEWGSQQKEEAEGTTPAAKSTGSSSWLESTSSCFREEGDSRQIPRALQAVVALLAVTAANEEKFEVGLVLLLTFFLYMRPSEFTKIRVQDIVCPVKKAPGSYKNWSILLHPIEEGVPSKTEQWDEMLALDLPYQQFVGPALNSHLGLKKRSKTQKAFHVTPTEVNQFMVRHWETLGLRPVGAPHLYRLRHGGASHEAGNHLRSLQAVQARGRWQSLKSVKNYEKGGRLAQIFDKVVQRNCLDAARGLARKFCRP